MSNPLKFSPGIRGDRRALGFNNKCPNLQMKRLLKQNFDHWIQIKMMKKANEPGNGEFDVPDRPKRGRKPKNFYNKISNENPQGNYPVMHDYSDEEQGDFDQDSVKKDPDFEPDFSRRVDFKIKASESPALSRVKSSLTTQSVAGHFIRGFK